MGEIQALRVENVHEEYLSITHAWTRKYGLVESSRTKNHSRDIPLPRRTYDRIQELCEILGDGFIFSFDGKEPANHTSIGTFFKETLDRAEIDHKARNITFHSWRHWFNTAMRAQRVPDSMLRSVTGHHSREMTELYTGFQLEHYKDVIDAQRAIFES